LAFDWLKKVIMAPRILNPISSARARAALAVSARPVWHELIPGMLAIGYRKTAKNPPAGFWTARRYLGDRKYEQQKLATADDTVSANGVSILDYRQACSKCRTWFEDSSAPIAPTITTAFEGYVATLRQRGKSTSYAIRRFDHDIGPTLGNIKLSDLTTARLQSWLASLAQRPRHARGKGGKPSKPMAFAAPDGSRKRQNSANRVWGLLRASLNHAFLGGIIDSNREWKRVKPFADASAPKIRFFDDDEIARLLAVIDGDFKLLVLAALHTGCRFSELANLKVRDFTDAGIFIAKSKSGKPRHIALTDVGVAFFDSITKGRDASEITLTKNGNRWKLSDETNAMRRACVAASIAHAGFHCLRHSYASHSIMKGCPLSVIARQLGHAGTAMTERHYAHLSQGYIFESIQKYGPTYK
jgi:integrase